MTSFNAYEGGAYEKVALGSLPYTVRVAGSKWLLLSARGGGPLGLRGVHK